ncbi:uncharacterized protein LOC100367213 [Saccoglossus kowalevskii]|uniref:Subtilisin-like protease CPC735_031240-like n=1 Tax=Saccoglossus kowalevskii TaxID=10224 RepID=A0ABM0M9R6_SACKO|nr:PREDICTED: subtilisin-like protease CPC735_031240-like [Saccoglossus kowalevskii]
MFRVILLSIALLSVAESGKAPVYQLDSKTLIADEYIVVFQSNTSVEAVVKHFKNVNSLISNQNTSFKILREFKMSHFMGYSFQGSLSTVKRLQEMPEIEFIEANQIMRASQNCIDQRNAEWGLVRTTERALRLDGIYSYARDATGDGVDAYVIDTGIYLEHTDFQGRATWGIDTIDVPSPETDENGHGTHVAGTIGGAMYGIAKDVNLIAVKVLNRDGAGSTDAIIDGVRWVEDNHLTKKTKSTNAKGSVANMSLGGGFSVAMNRAVESAISSGITFIAAAGNDYGTDACLVSPASVDKVITVGCTTNTDQFCVFSNAGTCVNILAPGEGITSCGIDGPFADITLSGTSMSSPHVAGVAAKYISSLKSTPTPAEVKKWLDMNATKDKITEIPADTPNKLLFMDCS